MTLKKIPHLDGIADIELPDVIVDDVVDLSSKDPRLKGIEFPSQLKNLDPYTKERWLMCVEAMIGRGIEGAPEIAALTGLSVKMAAMLKNAVLKRWGDSMTQGVANARREKLYYEAERIKAELWKRYADGEVLGADFKEQVTYLKMIVETGARQAKLCGLEVTQIEATVSSGNKTKDQMAQEAALNIPPEKLEQIGKLIAQEVGSQDNES